MNAQEVARVGDVSIDADHLRRTLARNGHNVYEKASVKAALGEVINFELLAAEAARLGLDRDPEVIEAAKRIMVHKLVSAKVDQAMAGVEITEPDRLAYYEAHRDEFSRAAMVRGTVISLVVRAGDKEATLAKAQKIMEEKTAGAQFADLVKKHSDFASEKASAGDTFWLVEGAANRRYPAAVIRALGGMDQVGEVSAPIVTANTIYLAQLTAQRPAEITPFEQVKAGVGRKAYNWKRQQLYDALCNDLRKSFPVKINEPAVAQVVEQTKLGATPPAGPIRITPIRR